MSVLWSRTTRTAIPRTPSSWGMRLIFPSSDSSCDLCAALVAKGEASWRPRNRQTGNNFDDLSALVFVSARGGLRPTVGLSRFQRSDTLRELLHGSIQCHWNFAPCYGNCGIAFNDRPGRHRLRNDAARFDHRSFTDHDVWKNHRAGPDECVSPDSNASELLEMRNHRRPDTDGCAIFNRNQVRARSFQNDIVSDPDSLSNPHPARPMQHHAQCHCAWHASSQHLEYAVARTFEPMLLWIEARTVPFHSRPSLFSPGHRSCDSPRRIHARHSLNSAEGLIITPTLPARNNSHSHDEIQIALKILFSALE